jgi:hypothetical protein
MTPVELASLIEERGHSGETVAIELLREPATEVLAETGAERADHWLRVWRLRRDHAETAGTDTFGFDDAFGRISRLPGEASLRLRAYQNQNDQRMLVAWFSSDGALVGYAVLKPRGRPTPAPHTPAA